jgi:hypothetical protein
MEAIRTALCCASAMLSRRLGVNGHLLRACDSRYGLAATRPQGLEPLRAELADLARRVPLALADAGGTAQIVDAAGARLMAGDPVTEAERAGWPR